MSDDGSFSLDLAELIEQTRSALDATVREIVIEVGSSLIRMSPVGNPELWAANVQFRDKTGRSADYYDFKVAARNTVINLTASNFTRNGRLKRGVKYAKPLTKAERVQNFNVNGLVAGKDYVGGRFRANWQFSLETPAQDVIDDVDPSGSKALGQIMTQVAGLTAGQTAYIVNNLPYALPLEQGHSSQAPHGMVRVTVARFQQIVNEAARSHQL